MTPRVAIVTGGGTGIGAGITARLADDGVTVLVGQRTEAEAVRAVAALAAPGRDLVPYGADLATGAGCRELVAAAVERYGQVDILVNNAGVTGPAAIAPLLDCDDARLDAVIDVNLKAPFRLVREAVPQMPAGSVVVNVSSVAAYLAQDDAAAYAAAKAGIVGLTRALGYELAPRGIRVVHVAPGDIRTTPDGTEMTPRGGQAPRTGGVRRTPLGRRGTPQDVASAVAWLCSADASFVTGTGLVVDGGWISY